MLEILVGPIGSGKSTYATMRAEDDAIIVSDDAIVAIAHGGIYTKYSRGLKPMYKAVEHTLITMSLLMDRDVLVDRPCMRVDTRAYYIGLARRYDVGIQAIVFPIEAPEDHAMRRAVNGDRGRPYEHWLKAATHQISEYQPPTQDEGFDSVLTINEAMEIHRQNNK